MSATLSRNEAADYLGISVPMLDNLSRQGTVARVKIGTGPRARVLFRPQDLDAFLAAHVQPVLSES